MTLTQDKTKMFLTLWKKSGQCTEIVFASPHVMQPKSEKGALCQWLTQWEERFFGAFGGRKKWYFQILKETFWNWYFEVRAHWHFWSMHIKSGHSNMPWLIGIFLIDWRTGFTTKICSKFTWDWKRKNVFFKKACPSSVGTLPLR